MSGRGGPLNCPSKRKKAGTAPAKNVPATERTQQVTDGLDNPTHMGGNTPHFWGFRCGGFQAGEDLR